MGHVGTHHLHFKGLIGYRVGVATYQHGKTQVSKPQPRTGSSASDPRDTTQPVRPQETPRKRVLCVHLLSGSNTRVESRDLRLGIGVGNVTTSPYTQHEPEVGATSQTRGVGGLCGARRIGITLFWLTSCFGQKESTCTSSIPIRGAIIAVILRISLFAVGAHRGRGRGSFRLRFDRASTASCRPWTFAEGDSGNYR